jgi:flagellar basal-body rod protein FlgC
MDFSTSFRLCASGLAAQRAKLDVVVSNLANATTTSTPEGGPYKRKQVVFTTETVKGPFNTVLKDALRMVKVKDVLEDKEGFRMVYDAGHPDADARGMVAMPNVNAIQEMADMIMASRAYEASINAFDATKNMALKTLEMGK